MELIADAMRERRPLLLPALVSNLVSIVYVCQGCLIVLSGALSSHDLIVVSGGNVMMRVAYVVCRRPSWQF
jgi:hypothetical protein